jgi:hypothetical protein
MHGAFSDFVVNMHLVPLDQDFLVYMEHAHFIGHVYIEALIRTELFCRSLQIVEKKKVYFYVFGLYNIYMNISKLHFPQVF